MKILIDNGHGKETPGKRSPVWPDGSQLYEYEFNRDIARRVYAVLTARGVDCELIVSEICDISLAERVRRVNKIARVVGFGLSDGCPRFPAGTAARVRMY